jgi:hypothetical protein
MVQRFRPALANAGRGHLRPALHALVALMALALALCSCAPAPRDVGHLRRDAWSLEEPRSLLVKFMRFDYQVQPVGGDVAGVKGWAYLDTSKVPQWARWVESLTLSVHLSDPEGHVLAQDSRSFLPRAASADQGVPFEFSLRPEQWGTRELFITFGYALVLTEGRDVEGGKQTFFASEDAITR